MYLATGLIQRKSRLNSSCCLDVGFTLNQLMTFNRIEELRGTLIFIYLR